MDLLVRLLLSAIAVLITAYLLPGVHVAGFLSALTAAASLALVNAFLRPVLLFLSWPINMLTLGLFTFVVIGLCVQFVSALVPGFHVQGFFWALSFALVLALVSSALEAFAVPPLARVPATSE